MTKYIIQDEMPYTWGESPRFEAYAKKMLNLAFKKVDRSVSREQTFKLFKGYKANIKQDFYNSKSKILLTSDLWTSCQNFSYMSVTAHYIDSSWTFQKRIIGFRRLESSYTGTTIASAIMQVLFDYEIQNKIFSITLVNASNNNVCVDVLKDQLTDLPLYGRLFHIRCCPHIFNLIVNAGLKLIKPTVEKK